MNDKIQVLKKYNFWGNKVIDLGYLRQAYTNKILDYSGNRLVKVLTGQRRSGKSYILRQVAKVIIDNGVLPDNTLIINKEFTDFDFLCNHHDLDELIKQYKSEIKPLGKIYIFLDEIQNIKDWEKVVNSYSQDYTDSYELYISGSNSKMLSGELATLLSGRYINIEIFPFSYNEFAAITGSRKNKDSYLEYLSGG